MSGTADPEEPFVGLEDDFFGSCDTIEPVWWDPKTGAVVFLGGELAVTKEFIETHDIQRIITVNEQGSPVTLPGVTWHDLPFLDDYSYRQSEQHGKNAAEAIETLRQAILNGEKVLVHCHAGMHRSPAVVYNALHLLGYFPSAYDAYCVVRKHREAAGFVKGLVKWSRKQWRAKYGNLQDGSGTP